MRAVQRGIVFRASRRAFERRMSALLVALGSQVLVVSVLLVRFASAREPLGVAICAPVLAGLLLAYGAYWVQVNRMYLEITDGDLLWNNGLGRQVRLARASVARANWVALGSRLARTSTTLQLADRRGRTVLLLGSSRWDIDDLEELRDLLDVPGDVVARRFSVGRPHRPGELRWGIAYTVITLLALTAASSTALLVRPAPTPSFAPQFEPVIPTSEPT